MPGRPNLAFFTLIAASLCAAVVFVGLLIARDVAGPTVATANSPTTFSRSVIERMASRTSNDRWIVGRELSI